MKKLMFLMPLALLLLIGCAKEETTPTALSSDDQKVEEASHSIFRINLDDPEMSVETISLESLQSNTGTTATQRANTSANGHFTSQLGNTLTFSAMQNNGGVHGQSKLTGEFWDIHMSSECIVVEDNQAVFSGQITQANIVPPGLEDALLNHPCGCFPAIVGTYLYFLVEDNGEGNNASSDRYSNQLYVSPEGFGTFCDQLSPTSVNPNGELTWDPAFILDTANESDQIQVSD